MHEQRVLAVEAGGLGVFDAHFLALPVTVGAAVGGVLVGVRRALRG
jgi:hypothetical protein